MSKIKVVHLTYDMRIGGTEMVIKNLVEGIDQARFDVEILCIQAELGPFGQMLKEQGVVVNHLNWQGGFDKVLIKQICQYIKANHVDILHCHQYSPWVYGALAAVFTQTKVIFTEHGRFYPDSSSWKRKVINPVLVGLTDYITAISKATKQALVDFEFIPVDKIDVIYNGISPLSVEPANCKSLKQQLGLPEDGKVLGTIARLDPIKNQTMMIRAFSRVLAQYSNSYLLIVGDGEERNKLEALVDELAIRNNVIFTGYIAKPADYLQLMDVFLLSSLSEGTSMTLLEAMSLGKPCVVTNAGGNPEIIIDGENGYVAENDNEAEFAEKIQLLLDDNNNTAVGMYQAAKTRFNENFAQQVMNSAFQAVYQRLS